MRDECSSGLIHDVGSLKWFVVSQGFFSFFLCLFTYVISWKKKSFLRQRKVVAQPDPVRSRQFRNPVFLSSLLLLFLFFSPSIWPISINSLEREMDGHWTSHVERRKKNRCLQVCPFVSFNGTITLLLLTRMQLGIVAAAAASAPCFSILFSLFCTNVNSGGPTPV